MILVDTNVLIAMLRATDQKIASLLRTESAAPCGIVKAELLQGARTIKERTEIMTLLGTLASVPIPESMWEEVGDNLARLRKLGLRLPLPDVTIATLAVALNVELWSRDAHFFQAQIAIPSLRLFIEPP